MNFFRVGFACVIAGAAGSVSADAMIDRSVEMLYESSALVMKARLVGVSASCTNGSCTSYVSEFTEIEKYKNYPKDQTTAAGSICSAPSLKVGKIYFLFVESIPMDHPDKDKCHAIVNFDAAFEERYNEFYRIDSYESSRIVDSHGRSFYTNAISEDNFIGRLSKISMNEDVD